MCIVELSTEGSRPCSHLATLQENMSCPYFEVIVTQSLLCTGVGWQFFCHRLNQHITLYPCLNFFFFSNCILTQFRQPKPGSHIFVASYISIFKLPCFFLVCCCFANFMPFSLIITLLAGAQCCFVNSNCQNLSSNSNPVSTLCTHIDLRI